MGALEGKGKQIIEMYVSKHLSLSKIAKELNVSRQAIYKVLKKEGIDTSKENACNVNVICSWCNKPFVMERNRYLRIKHNCYCSEQCYCDYMRELGKGYIYNRQAQRIARRTVEEIYGPLPEGSIVHHINKNVWNNVRENLMLFSSQSDHIKYHRGDKSIKPLWSGRDTVR